MPEEKAQALHDLRTYRSFLEALEEAGYDFAVIGGCAVAVYADQIGEPVFSADLDLIVAASNLPSLLDWARQKSKVRVTKVPQPRSAPVAVLYWNDLEVNILTGSIGLPAARQVTELAREVEIDGLVIPIADPFDLLTNKLAVRRDKDLPHIEILRRFVEAEIVTTFELETNRRRRLLPARRYLETFELKRLPGELAESLLAATRFDSDLRFLASTVPDSMGPAVRDKASNDPELLAELNEIFDRR